MFAIIVTSGKTGITREGQKFILGKDGYGFLLDYYDGGLLSRHTLTFDCLEKATDVVRQMLQSKERFHQCKIMQVEVVRLEERMKLVREGFDLAETCFVETPC